MTLRRPFGYKTWNYSSEHVVCSYLMSFIVLKLHYQAVLIYGQLQVMIFVDSTRRQEPNSCFSAYFAIYFTAFSALYCMFTVVCSSVTYAQNNSNEDVLRMWDSEVFLYTLSLSEGNWKGHSWNKHKQGALCFHYLRNEWLVNFDLTRLRLISEHWFYICWFLLL